MCLFLICIANIYIIDRKMHILPKQIITYNSLGVLKIIHLWEFRAHLQKSGSYWNSEGLSF